MTERSRSNSHNLSEHLTNLSFPIIARAAPKKATKKAAPKRAPKKAAKKATKAKRPAKKAAKKTKTGKRK